MNVSTFLKIAIFTAFVPLLSSCGETSGDTTDTTAPIVTATPTSKPFNSSFNVTLSANEAATIYYTTDGSTPTTLSNEYSTSINITNTTTLKYFAVDAKENASAPVQQIYTYDITPPTLTSTLSSPSDKSGTVSLTPSEESTIYYTTDGTTPTTTSSVYAGVLTVSDGTIIKAFAVDTAGNHGDTITQRYMKPIAGISSISGFLNFSDITQDSSGQYWMVASYSTSTAGSGLYKSDGSTVTNIDVNDTSKSSFVFVDNQQNVWHANKKYDGTTWVFYTNSLDANRSYGGTLGIQGMTYDNSNNLWFATNQGVSKFDGTAWTHYVTSDGLPHDSTYDVIQAKSGDIWVATYAGIARFDGTTWSTYTTSDGLIHNIVTDLAEDSSGNIWGASSAGVSKYNGASWITYTTTEGLPSNSVKNIFTDRSGNVWFGTSDAGVARYDGTNWKTYTTADGLPSNAVNAIFEDKDGVIWFACNLGIASLPVLIKEDNVAPINTTTENYISKTQTGVSLTANEPADFYYTTDGTTPTALSTSYTGEISVSENTVLKYMAVDIMGNESAVQTKTYIKDYVHEITYSTNDGLYSNNIPDITIDNSGNLWASAITGANANNWGKGEVYQFDGTAWNFVTSGYVLALSRNGSANEMWFGFMYGALQAYDGTTTTAVPNSPVPVSTSSSVYSILRDSNNIFWVAHPAGLEKYDGTNWTTLTALDVNSTSGVGRSLFEDSQNTIWVGLRYGGVSHFDGTTWVNYTTTDGLIDNTVVGFAEDSNNNIWMATASGISVFDGTNWTTYNTSNGLTSNTVNDIAVDGNGHILVATSSGFDRFDGTTWYSYTGEDGIPGLGAVTKVNNLVFDLSGNLWLATINGGIAKFKPALKGR